MDYKEKVIALLNSKELSKERKEKLESIFPELVESDEERIRKSIIEHLKCDIDDMAKSDSAFDYEAEIEELSKYIAWLEKQCKSSVCKVKIGETYKCIASPRYTCFRMGDIYRVEDNFVAELINTCSGCFVLLEKQGEQKPADKIEPKFKVGDWVVNNTTLNSCHILKVEHGQYICDDCSFPITKENEYHLWTILDAKDGDVLSYVTDEEDLWIMIYQSLYEPYDRHVHYHALLFNDNFTDKGTCCICMDNLKPATEEQCDLFFAKMKEAGYEWDAEKKELKKIEQTSADETPYPETLEKAIDLYYYSYGNGEGEFEHLSLEKFRDIVHTFVSDYGQNTAWSEEDENRINRLIAYFEDKESFTAEDDIIYANWLKSLKDRVLPKQEWSEDDKRRMNNLYYFLEEYGGQYYGELTLKDMINWFNKSLRPQNNITDEELAQAKKDAYNDVLDKIEYHSGEPTFDDGWSAAIWYLKKKNAQPQSQWKPSDGQINVCKEVYADILSTKGFDLGTVNSELNRLEAQLKKLKEE